MIKLLLKEEKKEIKKEYAFRFLIILFLGLSFVSIFLLISLIPSYFLLKVNQKVLIQELSVAQNVELNTDRQKLKDKLNELQKILDIVDTKNYNISYNIKNITDRQSRDINIQNLEFSNENSQEIFLIQGVANTRGSLASFIDTLETIPEFEYVNLPFSSFARDTDIPFSIKINLLSQTNEK